MNVVKRKVYRIEFHLIVLGLIFHVRDDGLGVYDPVEGKWVQTSADASTERAEQAEAENQRL